MTRSLRLYTRKAQFDGQLGFGRSRCRPDSSNRSNVRSHCSIGLNSLNSSNPLNAFSAWRGYERFAWENTSHLPLVSRGTRSVLSWCGACSG
jgi:hypothetical protein